MANVLAPFGFSYVGHTDGRPPNFGAFTALVTSTLTTAIFKGDWCSQINSGFIAQAAAGAAGIGAGVFWGCLRGRGFASYRVVFLRKMEVTA